MQTSDSMEDAIGFEDYLLGGIHESFFKNSDENLWARKQAI